MNIEDENMEWKKEAPHLASLPKHNPYSVPENYFGELKNQTNLTVFIDSLLQKENHVFSVPENYFEQLTSQIQTKVAISQINLKKDGFDTPKNYFETLQGKIIDKTSQKPTKTIRIFTSVISKYAAAACVVLISAVVLFINPNNRDTIEKNTELANEQLLYGIDESIIIEHIQENNTSSNTENQDLENYILNNFSTKDLSNNL